MGFHYTGRFPLFRTRSTLFAIIVLPAGALMYPAREPAEVEDPQRESVSAVWDIDEFFVLSWLEDILA